MNFLRPSVPLHCLLIGEPPATPPRCAPAPASEDEDLWAERDPNDQDHDATVEHFLRGPICLQMLWPFCAEPDHYRESLRVPFRCGDRQVNRARHGAQEQR